jgi:ABC-2 type transport system permease protein
MLRDRLLGNVFTKTIRDWLLWTVIAIVALWLLALMYVAVMSGSGDAYVTMLEDFPDIIANLYGLQDGTAEGMALAGMYSMMAPLVLLTYAIGLGASAAVGEEEAGTLPILLSSPLRRRSIVVAKAVVVVIGVFLVTAGMWLGLEVSAAIFGVDFSQHDQISSAIQLIGMVLLFGALSLGVSAATGSSAIGIGVAAGVAVVSYFLTTLLPIVEELADLARLTPWWLYTGAEALYEGLDPVLLVIALVIAAVLFGAGAYRLDRRDLKG